MVVIGVAIRVTKNKWTPKNSMTELIKHPDGRVTRLSRCECGEPLYKKDLTNDKYEILKKNRNSRVQTLVFETNGYCKINCPECSLSHIILDVKENIVLT